MPSVTLELALLSVEFVLLIATVILLYLSRREHAGRHELLRLLSQAITALTRREYFSAVQEAIRDAREGIIAVITGTPPRDEEEEEVLNSIARRVREASARGVRLRYLIPRSAAHLYVGHLLCGAGAEVRYRAGLAVYDLRYMVVDGRRVILGQPRGQGEEEPTKKGYVIESPTLASMLAERFETHWGAEETITYEEYVRQEVRSLYETNPGLTPETAAGQLNLPVEEVKRLAGDLWRSLPPG